MRTPRILPPALVLAAALSSCDSGPATGPEPLPPPQFFIVSGDEQSSIRSAASC